MIVRAQHIKRVYIMLRIYIYIYICIYIDATCPRACATSAPAEGPLPAQAQRVEETNRSRQRNLTFGK